MVFPLSTDRYRGHAGPVTIAIIAISIFVHFFTESHRLRIRSEKKAIEAYVNKELMEQERSSAYRKIEDSTKVEEKEFFTEEELLEYQKQVTDSLDQSSFNYKASLKPAEFSFPHLLSYMFVHNNWLHLIANIWILFIVSLMLEHYWSSKKYAIIVLTIGTLSGVAYLITTDVLQSQLVSPPYNSLSGLIAGLMGAFLIQFASLKIKFGYIFVDFRYRKFILSAWAYVLFWIIVKTVYAITIEKYTHNIYWAHGATFAIGAVLGALISGRELYPLPKEDEVLIDENGNILIDDNEGKVEEEELEEIAFQYHPTNMAWVAYLQKDYVKAEKEMIAGFEHYVKNPAGYRDQIRSDLNHLINTAHEIEITSEQFGLWAMELSMKGEKELSLICYEQGYKTNSDPHAQLRERLRAATIRVEAGIELYKAMEELNYICQHEAEGGAMRTEAEYLLQQLEEGVKTKGL